MRRKLISIYLATLHNKPDPFDFGDVGDGISGNRDDVVQMLHHAAVTMSR
jgi:hypothetical protein